MTASKPRPMPGAIPPRPCWPVPGDGRGLYAQWICAVHRRGVRQQCVLDRRYRADCLLDCGGDFYPWLGVHLLPDRKPAAAGHAALYDTPRYQRFRRLLTRVIAHKWRVAAGVVALFIVAIPA